MLLGLTHALLPGGPFFKVGHPTLVGIVFKSKFSAEFETIVKNTKIAIFSPKNHRF